MTVESLSSASCSLCEQRQPVHPGHVDVAHDHVDMRILLERLQRLEAVMGEHEADRAVADLPAELLQDQRLEVWLVVDEREWSLSCGLSEPVVDLLPQGGKIDRLGQQALRAALDRLAPASRRRHRR